MKFLGNGTPEKKKKLFIEPRVNKTGLKPASRPVEQILGCYPKGLKIYPKGIIIRKNGAKNGSKIRDSAKKPAVVAGGLAALLVMLQPRVQLPPIPMI